jgi:hypothetical protein
MVWEALYLGRETDTVVEGKHGTMANCVAKAFEIGTG